ncbi:sulfhydrogenase 2 subunit gamma [Nanobdella aerobiophila]|uniref:Sulfhydrogenase 2 subunit gamma n=1 Tax=Nanobdella aerobiophila TaxID=2586965 RepID=A0A915WSL9_9ARCH|nr:FAD-dependent oxidoreductase [Nanobdella aerobiophila]BBL45342.1 sulfhydrogenase 2 subunit gamma [Nanobdella aerobiophila]
MKEAKVIYKKLLNDNIIELGFEKVIDFIPGQFIRLYINNELREFSIISIPTDNCISIISTLSESDYKKNMRNLKEGDLVYIEGPYGGNLSLKKNKNIVMIAGGIGIAPFLSDIRYIVKNNLDYNIKLFYSVKYFKDAVYLDELKKSKIDLILTITREKVDNYENSHINMELLKKYINNLDSYDFYICGSTNFSISMLRMLKENNIKNIFIEIFTGYK